MYNWKQIQETTVKQQLLFQKHSGMTADMKFTCQMTWVELVEFNVPLDT